MRLPSVRTMASADRLGRVVGSWCRASPRGPPPTTPTDTFVADNYAELRARLCSRPGCRPSWAVAAPRTPSYATCSATWRTTAARLRWRCRCTRIRSSSRLALASRACAGRGVPSPRRRRGAHFGHQWRLRLARRIGRAEKVDGGYRITAASLRQRRAGRRPLHDDGHLRRSDRRSHRSSLRHSAHARGSRSRHLANARHAWHGSHDVAGRRVRAGRRRRRRGARPAAGAPSSTSSPRRLAADLLRLRRRRRGRARSGAARGGRRRDDPRPRSWSARWRRAGGRTAGAPSDDRRGRRRPHGTETTNQRAHRPDARRPGGHQDGRARAWRSPAGPASSEASGLERLFRDVQGARYHPLRGSAQLATRAGSLSVWTSTTRRRHYSRKETAMHVQTSFAGCIGLLAAWLLAGAPCAQADVVTDANAKAADIASRHPATPDRGEDDGHRPGLGVRGRQRDHRAVPAVPREDQRRRRAPRWTPRWRRRHGPRC